MKVYKAQYTKGYDTEVKQVNVFAKDLQDASEQVERYLKANTYSHELISLNRILEVQVFYRTPKSKKKK